MKVKDEARKKLQLYAWPGGYPIYYLAREGWREDDGKLDFNRSDRDENICCARCATNVEKWPDLIITATDINYEDEDLYCEYCSEKIESAYKE